MIKLLKQINSTPPAIFGGIVAVFLLVMYITKSLDITIIVCSIVLAMFLVLIYYQVSIIKKQRILDDFAEFLISMDNSIDNVFNQYFKNSKEEKYVLQMGDAYYNTAFSEKHIVRILKEFNRFGLSKYSIFIMLLERALFFYLKVIETNPQSYVANLQVANIYYHINHFREAKKYYTIAVNIDSTNSKVFYYRGLCNRQLNDLKSAHEDLYMVLFLDNSNTEAYQMRGLINYVNREYIKAIEDFKSYLKKSPNDTEILFFKGASESHLKRYNDAITSFSKAIEINPNYVDALKDRALVYYHLRNYDLGLIDIDKSISIEPNNFHNYFVKGMIYSAQDKIIDAIFEFARAVEIDPKVPEPYYELAKLASKLNKNEEAISQLDKALEKNPYYIEALELRGNLKIAAGDFVGGKRDLDSVSKFRVNNFYDIALN
jgi:tetratricopeptide (TPR) repeat protein